MQRRLGTDEALLGFVAIVRFAKDQCARRAASFVGRHHQDYVGARLFAARRLLPRCNDTEFRYFRLLIPLGDRRYPVDSGALLARLGGMKRVRKSEPAAPKLRSWRVGVIRKRLEHLGLSA